MRNITKLLTLVVLCLVGMQGNAQNVTVSPSTGSIIASLTSGSEIGSAGGWGALWRHEQLPLSLTVSDDPDLTLGGEIANPAGNLYEKDGRIVVLGGIPNDGYMVLSLPKGYRITGYRLVLLNDNIGVTFPAYGTIRGVQKRFYETNATYDINNYKARAHVEGYEQRYQMAASNESTEYVIERTSKTDDDMGNQLYFRLYLNDHNGNNTFAVLTIKSFEIYFTAEGTFEADVKPDDVGAARSVVQAPFKTSKLDIGELTTYTKEVNGVTGTYYGYNYQNVRDLDAYNYIYQSNAVQNGAPTEGTEAKTIYPLRVDNKDVFAYGNNTYYVETPIQVHTQSGLEAPVGYRIVGARFNYLWGTQTGSTTEERTNYYITYTSGGKTYYLNDQLHFTENKFAWFYNSSNQNIYTGSGDNIRYLSCTGSGGTRTLTFSTENGGYYNLQVFTNNGNTYIGWPQMTYYGYSGYVVGNTTGATATMVRNNGAPTNAAIWVVQTENVTIPAFNPGAYTLKVFDKEGNYEEDESTGKPTKGLKAVVNSASDAGGILELENLNNDAVKFQISGLENGKQALVSVTLLLQALDPYIDQMNIVCHDPDDQLTLSQPFTADDFSVSGGSFKFYIPEDYEHTLLTFTFSDLYSHYGDETYPGQDGSNFGRYSFVTSEYFEPINGNGNDGLYDNAYDPDAEYTNKVFTSTAGNIRFKFNNAEDLGANQSGEVGTGYLEENAFSVADYLGSEDPDGGSDVGAFIGCQLAADLEGVSKGGTFYVFTADETRYNIAPTTAWQHRSYAFYRMDIELEAKSYTPNLTWAKVYDKDKTFYGDDGKTNSQWGLKLKTKDGNNEVTGYLTVKEILDAIDARTKDDTAAPKETNQILYIDASELHSIVNSSITEGGTTTTKDLSSLKQDLGQNAIIFLPESMTTTLDNFAFKTGSGSFRAGHHIVLTDKNPFYSPYDIQVDAANYAKYSRQITCDDYGKVNNATLILPFALEVTSGVHTNETADACSFSLNTMKPGQEIEQQTQSPSYVIPNVVFLPIGGESSEANKPYVVEVKKAATGSDNSNYSFVATQSGATIVKTPTQSDDSPLGQQFYTGETAGGTYKYTSVQPGHAPKTVEYSCTAEGNFSGVKYDREVSENVFYFAANQFINLHTLNANERYLLVYPFRSVYTYPGDLPINFFNAIFDDEIGETDAIAEMPKHVDLAVRSGKGYLSMTSAIDQTVNVRTLNGMSVGELNMRAGDNRSINLPAGIYLVNNVKIIVK